MRNYLKQFFVDESGARRHLNGILGVAGFALPGNFVDVMENTPDENNRPISKIVLESTLELAVAQDANTGDNKPRIANAVTVLGQLLSDAAGVATGSRASGRTSIRLNAEIQGAGAGGTRRPARRRNEVRAVPVRTG